MRAWGVTYDTGFVSAGTTTHEPFDPDVVRREMHVIRHVLHADAVRVTGGVGDRLEIAAAHAADQGLEVWYCPFTNDLTQDQLLDFVLDAASRAEGIRRRGGRVVLVTGSEISLFTHGFLPGRTLGERLAVLGDPQRLRTVLPGLPAAVNDFLGRLVVRARERFGGRITYASLPHEGVDWRPFDLAASDAVYRDANNAGGFEAAIRTAVGEERPFAVTEFGCTTYRGAAALGARSESVIEWDDRGRPQRLREPVVRDEDEQAMEVCEVLGILDRAGVDTAFVNTFARRDLPTSTDPARDFDVASWGIVKVLENGLTSTSQNGMPWEPKAAFHALAALAVGGEGLEPPASSV